MHLANEQFAEHEICEYAMIFETRPIFEKLLQKFEGAIESFEWTMDSFERHSISFEEESSLRNPPSRRRIKHQAFGSSGPGFYYTRSFAGFRQVWTFQ
jgi:hypothetical protein